MTVIFNEDSVVSEMLSIEQGRCGNTLGVPLLQFYQQIQAIIIMGQILNLITRSKPLSDYNQREFARLDLQIQNLMKALFDPAAGLMLATCEALSIHRV